MGSVVFGSHWVGGAHLLEAAISRAWQKRKLGGERNGAATAGGQRGNETQELGLGVPGGGNGTHLLETASQGSPRVLGNFYDHVP